MDADGPHHWPGTTVRTHEVNAGLVDIEWRWLGLRETTVGLQESSAGWEVGSPAAGPAHGVQAILACVVPGAVMGFVVSTGLRRRATLAMVSP